MSRTWKEWPGCDCPDCGSGTEVFAEEKPLHDLVLKDEGCVAEVSVGDQDPVRCSDPACPRHTRDLGSISVYDDGDATWEFEAWPVGDDGKPCMPETMAACELLERLKEKLNQFFGVYRWGVGEAEYSAMRDALTVLSDHLAEMDKKSKGGC